MIYIYNNNKKSILFFLISVAMVMFGIYALYWQLFFYKIVDKWGYVVYKKMPLKYALILKAAGSKEFWLIVILLLIFILNCYMTLIEISKKPVIIIDQDGFHTSKFGFIRWDEIEKFDYFESKAGKSHQEFFLIYLKDPIKFWKNRSTKNLFYKILVEYRKSNCLQFRNLVLDPSKVNEIQTFKDNNLLK